MLFCDDAQRYDKIEYEWLQIRMFTFPVGRKELLAVKVALQHAQDADSGATDGRGAGVHGVCGSYRAHPCRDPRPRDDGFDVETRSRQDAPRPLVGIQPGSFRRPEVAVVTRIPLLCCVLKSMSKVFATSLPKGVRNGMSRSTTYDASTNPERLAVVAEPAQCCAAVAARGNEARRLLEQH